MNYSIHVLLLFAVFHSNFCEASWFRLSPNDELLKKLNIRLPSRAERIDIVTKPLPNNTGSTGSNDSTTAKADGTPADGNTGLESSVSNTAVDGSSFSASLEATGTPEQDWLVRKHREMAQVRPFKYVLSPETIEPKVKSDEKEKWREFQQELIGQRYVENGPDFNGQQANDWVKAQRDRGPARTPQPKEESAYLKYLNERRTEIQGKLVPTLNDHRADRARFRAENPRLAGKSDSELDELYWQQSKLPKREIADYSRKITANSVISNQAMASAERRDVGYWPRRVTFVGERAHRQLTPEKFEPGAVLYYRYPDTDKFKENKLAGRAVGEAFFEQTYSQLDHTVASLSKKGLLGKHIGPWISANLDIFAEAEFVQKRAPFKYGLKACSFVSLMAEDVLLSLAEEKKGGFHLDLFKFAMLAHKLYVGYHDPASHMPPAARLWRKAGIHMVRSPSAHRIVARIKENCSKDPKHVLAGSSFDELVHDPDLRSLANELACELGITAAAMVAEKLVPWAPVVEQLTASDYEMVFRCMWISHKLLRVFDIAPQAVMAFCVNNLGLYGAKRVLKRSLHAAYSAEEVLYPLDFAIDAFDWSLLKVWVERMAEHENWSSTETLSIITDNVSKTVMLGVRVENLIGDAQHARYILLNAERLLFKDPVISYASAPKTLADIVEIMKLNEQYLAGNHRDYSAYLSDDLHDGEIASADQGEQ